MALDIQEIDSQFKRLTRQTRVVNVYDSQVGQGSTWEGDTPWNQRVLKDIIWDRVIQGRVYLLGDVNTYSPVWNPHYQKRQNTEFLEDFIEKFDLLINNESGWTTRPASAGVFVIDLALSIIELGFLTFWEIPKKYLLFSDHELIFLQ